MKIKIASLDNGLHELSYSGDVREIGLDEPYKGQYKLDLELDKAQHQLVLRGTLNANADMECDVCGEPFEKHFAIPVEIVYLFGEEPEGHDDPDIVYLPMDVDHIKIGQELYDYAHLALPMRILCGGDDCTRRDEVLPKREENEIDERWRPLLELKKKLNKN